jgi:protease-4
MKFIHILTELYCKPCLILPAMHHRICSIVDAHIDGSAHDSDGIVARFAELSGEVDDGGPKMSKAGNIAVIPINGVIGKKVSGIMKSSGVSDVDDIAGMVQSALADDDIEGIMLDVSSPGGGVTGVPEAANVIAEARKHKPVLAYTDDLMASAAMWLSAGATAIMASESAQVGSIGVYMAFLDQSRAFEMAGYEQVLIKTGKFKGMGAQGTSLNEEQRALLQSEVDEVFGWFKAHILAHRNVDASAMEGQTFYAKEAIGVGLIDRVGSVEDAVNELRAMIRLGVK